MRTIVRTNERVVNALRAEVKGDVNTLRGEINTLRAEMNGKLGEFKAEMNGGFSGLREEIKAGNHQLEIRLIRWFICTAIAVGTLAFSIAKFLH